jgi:ATP-dependent DNA helicase RecQ
VNEYVDTYHQEEIYDYFREAESDSIQSALTNLGEDEFNEEEIRLMRIKFMSDLGN